MIKSVRFIMRILASILLILVLMTALCPQRICAAKKASIRVAYIDYENFIEQSSDGSYTGYGAEYLKRIAQYTGWEYEFVDMDWPTAYQAVKEGEIDFYCVARQTEERQEEFDFSLYPICNEEMNLYTLPNQEVYYEDYEAFNGMRIGILEKSGELDYFKAYARKHGLSYNLVEYPRNEAAILALQEKEVDAIALANYSVIGEYKLVDNFGVSPAYLMSRDGSRYMEEFSEAQERLYFDDPAYTQKLNKKYYDKSTQYTKLLLTRDEANYIEDAGTLSVAVSKDMAPIEYFDKVSGTYQGITIDLYHRITEMTGLDFRFVPRMDSDSLISQMEHGEVQLVGALAQSDLVAKSLKLIQTTAFSDNSMVLVTKNFSRLSKDSIVAIPKGYPLFLTIAEMNGYSNILMFDRFEECIDAVYKDKADLAIIISMCESYLLDHAQYSKLQAFPMADTSYNICFGMYQGYDNNLVSILNKCISVIPSHDMNEIILTNTGMAKPEQNLYDFMDHNKGIVFAAVLLIVTLIAYAIIRSVKARQQGILNKSLQKHQSFLQHLYDSLPCGILRYSYEIPHRILSCNTACAKIYGYEDKDQFIRALSNKALENEIENVYPDKFEQCEKTATPIVYVWPIIRKNESQGFMEFAMDIVETENGKVFQEIFIDVTERVLNEKLVEKRYLQELNRRGNFDEGLLYYACFDITDQLLTYTDMEASGIYPGMSVTEFLEAVPFEFVDFQTKDAKKDYREHFELERLQEDYENGHFEQSFSLCLRKDNQIQWLKNEFTLRHNPQNGHLMCFYYVHDITDEYVTGEIFRDTALSNCESMMSVLIQTRNCLQYEVDKNGKLIRTESIYGENDLLSLLAENMSDNDAEEFRKSIEFSIIEDNLKEANRYHVYATWNEEAGERLDKAMTFFYTSKEAGILAVTISDITEVRASEVIQTRLLKDALSEAEKADEAKSQFLSRVSHEMRTPLNAIIGFIELAKEANQEQQADYLVSSDMAAKQLLNVINDVLDMSSIASGKLKLSHTDFHFKKQLDALANIYGTQCRQKGVEFDIIKETPLEDWLVGDEMRLNQILMNLLGNAIKFTSKGHIYLTVENTRSDINQIFLRFTVEDTGCGMSQEMLKRVFKPFEQESSSTARKYGGNGLGLSIVKNLVSMMSGSIRVESKQGEGTTFLVDLPFKRSSIIGNKEDLPTGEKSTDSLEENMQNKVSEWNFTGKRVLLVEDNALNQIVAKGYLAKYHVIVDLAENGKIGVDKFLASKSGYYDAILMDIQLPIMDGFEATKVIRESKHPDAMSIQIIAQTADAFNEDKIKALAAGMNAHISKPIKSELLAEELYRAFQQNR